MRGAGWFAAVESGLPVSGNGRVGRRRVGIDSAGEVLHVFKSGPSQERQGGLASNPMMAERDDLFVGIKLVEAGMELAEGDQDGTGKVHRLVLPRLPNIEEKERRPRLYFFFYFHR